MGFQVLLRELEDIGLEKTPQYYLYKDETQNKLTFPQLAEELEPMPEVRDHSIGAEILLPGGDEMARGHLVACSCDASGNVMGRAHTNPILHSRMCQIEVAGDEVTEWTTNVIAESMNALCDAIGSKYLLLDLFVDYIMIKRQFP